MLLLIAGIPFRYLSAMALLGVAILPIAFYVILPEVSERGPQRLAALGEGGVDDREHLRTGGGGRGWVAAGECDQAGVDVGGGPEDVAADGPRLAHVGVPGRLDRRHAVDLGAGAGGEAVGDLGLHHDQALAQRGQHLEQVQHDRDGHVVGQVGDDPRLPAAEQLRQVDGQGIAVDHFLARWTTFVPAVPRYLLASILCLGGIALVGWALGLFRRAGTRAEPWHPSSALVLDGVYRFTRNPMYLGMAAIYAGIALIFDSAVSLLLGIPLILIIQRTVIAREERYLTARFGDDYRRYMSQVRRWI